MIEERNSSDNSLLAHYRYADRLLSLDTGNEVQYYHHDALGSTVNLTTDTGDVKVSYWLDPYGQIRKQEGSSINRQIFTGQEHDEKTGLVYFGARYYDPDTARFITQDSYLGETGTPPSLHRYLYAYSNPTVYVDLYGYSVTLGGTESDYFVSRLQSSSNDWIDSHPMATAVADAKGISSTEALEYIRNEYSHFGINDKNAVTSATITVEIGDSSDDLIVKSLEYMGKGFGLAYSADASLREKFNKNLSGANPGDIIDLSQYWQMAFGGMMHRAANKLGNEQLKQAYEGKTSWYNLITNTRAAWQLNSSVAQDELAPDSERLWHRVGAFIDKLDQGSLILGATKLSASLGKAAGYQLSFKPQGLYGGLPLPSVVKASKNIYQSTDEILQELFDSGKYSRRVAGKHHLTPFALGNTLRYGHKSLTQLGSMKHSVLQGALDEHLRSITKVLPNGKVVDMLPRNGNPGARVRRMFSLDERIEAVDSFYKTFAEGRFYPAFRMELNAARKAGKLK